VNRRAVVEHEIALLILRVAGAGLPAVWWLIGIGVVDALFGVVALMMHGRLHRSALDRRRGCADTGPPAFPLWDGGDPAAGQRVKR